MPKRSELRTGGFDIDQPPRAEVGAIMEGLGGVAPWRHRAWPTRELNCRLRYPRAATVPTYDWRGPFARLPAISACEMVFSMPTKPPDFLAAANGFVLDHDPLNSPLEQ
jgi:hypothetical protein